MKPKAPPAIIIDYETEGIEQRPEYPPKPVSVAIKWPDVNEYELLAWGHGNGTKAHGNNCTEKQARSRLQRAYNSRYPLLFQNAVFDLDVAEEHWELRAPTWERVHDTLFMIFLYDPHAPSLSLKPAAERILGLKPEEQDRMYEWIIANVPEAARKPSTAGAYICRCPYQIVKPYHKGDLIRTIGIFNKLYPYLEECEMLPAYQRELKLMPMLLRNARRGMRLNMDQLEQDLPALKAGLEKVDHKLQKRLGIDNIDSDKQLGKALYDKGIIKELKYTAKGQISVSKKNLLIEHFKDPKIYHELQYRNQMRTSISMFMEPWLQLGTAGKGRIHPNWSQVRAPKGDSRDTSGARSGRIICSKPNFLNIPKKWKRAIVQGYKHPTWMDVPQLPYIRTYCLPDKGKQWGRRDWNQQEVRLFSHFEEGPVRQGFLDNPRFDVHEGVREEEERTLIAAGLRDEFDRDSAKTTVFGAFYGQGVSGLMDALKLREEDRAVGVAINKALHRAVPSIKQLSNALKDLAYQGLPIRTWGGRLYYCEAPAYSQKYKRDMTFEYKLISYLIQGSGADVVKEALIRYDAHPKRQEDLIVTVYDEIDVNLPMSAKGAKQEMTLLRDIMQSIECDVPMLSDGETGPNWGTMSAYAV